MDLRPLDTVVLLLLDGVWNKREMNRAFPTPKQAPATVRAKRQSVLTTVTDLIVDNLGFREKTTILQEINPGQSCLTQRPAIDLNDMGVLERRPDLYKRNPSKACLTQRPAIDLNDMGVLEKRPERANANSRPWNGSPLGRIATGTLLLLGGIPWLSWGRTVLRRRNNQDEASPGRRKTKKHVRHTMGPNPLLRLGNNLS